MSTNEEEAFTVRYHGSLAQYAYMLGCATMEGEWTGPDTTRYTVVLWDGRGTLSHVRHQSLEFNAATVWPPEMGPCVCSCGANHNRWNG